MTRQFVTQLARPRHTWSSAAKSLVGIIAIGVALGGFVIGGLGTNRQSLAATSDRDEGYVTCTAKIEEGLEGVYILDSLTGDLKCMVISAQTGKFVNFYQRNVLQDMGPEAAKNPQFLLVSGVVDFRHMGGSTRTAGSAIYVVEVNTGTISAYTIPWAGDRQRQSTRPQGPFDLIRLDTTVFRGAVVAE
ncbi:MAG: hypothetical protein R3C10_20550 [Pirellulales bacterium]|nr:hypothetical protein [Planctomycetales bacterium]